MEKALQAKRESKSVDFKRTFDPTQASDWCELVKDIVAIANSGGGYIIVGVEDDGTPGPAGACEPLLTLDPAVLTDKVAKYTGVQYESFAIAEAVRDGHPVGILQIDAVTRPLIMEKPGTYPVADGKQKTAFGVGTIYVRHGAKSAPAGATDVNRIVERLLHAARKEWMDGVRKVVNAPAGSTVSVLPRVVRQTDDPTAMPIRISSDPDAPEYRLVDPDSTHPWRQKELIAQINGAVEACDKINSFDIFALRHLYQIDGEVRYFHKSKYGAPQYSEALKDWLLTEYARDHEFFRRVRDEYRQQRDA
jgi:hypothetical protein